jgi:hypothetical protein
MEAYQPLLFVLVAVVMGWFGGGVIWNLRRGSAMLKWMQAGLPALGEKTTLRWLGSSAVQLSIAKARPPYRRFELVVVMEPRDVPWLWALSRAQGRRDLLILRAQLTSAPRLEYDLVAPASWTGRPVLEQAAQARWGSEELEDYRFLAPTASLPVSSRDVPGLLESARQVGPKIWRLSVRRSSSAGSFTSRCRTRRRPNAQQFFESVRSLGQQAMSRGGVWFRVDGYLIQSSDPPYRLPVRKSGIPFNP